MSIKFVALDTDGTLLNSNSQILTSTVEVVKKALSAGIKVALCSGRPIAGLKPYMDQLGIVGSDQYALTGNGAITMTAAGEIMTEDLVASSFYRPLTAFALAHQLPFNIVDDQSRIITANHNVHPMVYQQAYENQATLFIRTPDEMPADLKIAKGCFVGSEELLDKWTAPIQNEFGQNLNVLRTDRFFLEVLNPKVNKGNGLKELTEKLEISPAEVMAIGDERNDISMFDFAGTAVCMENGSQQAKEHADYNTSSNDHDGIAQAFEKFVF